MRRLGFMLIGFSSMGNCDTLGDSVTLWVPVTHTGFVAQPFFHVTFGIDVSPIFLIVTLGDI